MCIYSELALKKGGRADPADPALPTTREDRPPRVPAADASSAYGSRVRAFVTRVPLAVGDLICVGLGLLVAAGFGLVVGVTPVPTEMATFGILAMVATTVPMLAFAGAFGVVDSRTETKCVVVGLLRAAAILAVAGLAFLPGRSAGQAFLGLIVTFGVASAVAPILRRALRDRLGRYRWWGEPALVLGSDEGVANMASFLTRHAALGLRPVRIAGSPSPNGEALDDTDLHVRWAVADSSDSQPEVTRQLLENSQRFHRLLVVDSGAKSDGRETPHGSLALDGAVARVLCSPQETIAGTAFKLTFDIAVGGLLAVASLPLLLICAVAVHLDSPGPIFFGHKRIGRNGKHFRVWKFRTMVCDAERRLEELLAARPDIREAWERNHKLENDPRTTRIGRFLRTTSLDELPQLWNVLRGEMSLIGPRPIVDDEVSKYGTPSRSIRESNPASPGCGRSPVATIRPTPSELSSTAST